MLTTVTVAWLLGFERALQRSVSAMPDNVLKFPASRIKRDAPQGRDGPKGPARAGTVCYRALAPTNLFANSKRTLSPHCRRFTPCQALRAVP
jgi:hypothetical protein